MEKNYFVLVTGNGDTSRANIEALMEDHYYAKGEGGTLVLAYEKAPTKAQTLVAQYAKVCNKDIIVFCHEDAQTTGVPGASQSTHQDPIREAVIFVKETDSVAFLLWDEQDDQCFSALKGCLSQNVQAFNLCDGLVPLNEAIKVPVKPLESVESLKPEPMVKMPQENVPQSLEDELSACLKRAQEIVQEIAKCRQNSL
jgi:hypothetical protein